MLRYRSAIEADLPFIIGLVVEDAVLDTGDDPADALHADYRKALAAINTDPNQEMIVVERDAVPVGCFQLSYVPGLMRRGMWRATIVVIHVTASARNLGIGSEMMLWALERARERGCGVAQLTSNKKREDAHRFYERLGFKKSHEGFKYYL